MEERSPEEDSVGHWQVFGDVARCFCEDFRQCRSISGDQVIGNDCCAGGGQARRCFEDCVHEAHVCGCDEWDASEDRRDQPCDGNGGEAVPGVGAEVDFAGFPFGKLISQATDCESADGACGQGLGCFVGVRHQERDECRAAHSECK